MPAQGNEFPLSSGAKYPPESRSRFRHGFEGQIRPRSGLAIQYGITVLNAPGTIDSDYRGLIDVILINHGSTDFSIERGDRIAQLVIAPVVRASFVPDPDLEETERSNGGFGHTGR